MAENIVENTKSLVDDHEMADVTSTEDATNDEASCAEKKKSDTVDTENAEPNLKEVPLTSLEKEKDTSENSVQPVEDQSACKSDCNGDPKEIADAEEEKSVDNAIPKTKESNLKESNSVETKSSDESAVDYLPDVDERLSEILKVVHGDLHVNFLKSVKTPAAAQDDADEDNGEKEQPTAVKETDILEDDAATDSTSKDCAASAAIKDAEDEINSRESTETKVEERSELGIVGPPTAVSELINEEELGGDSALSADQKEHIVEWVENSVKVKVEEENNHAEENKLEYIENDAAEERVKRKKVTDIPSISIRKSQKLVSNIIKKSIKCLNKMHAMEGTVENRRNVNTAEEDKTKASSSQVPQSQQNGAALPEETATTAPTAAVNRAHTKNDIKNENSHCDVGTLVAKSKQLLTSGASRQKLTPGNVAQRHPKYESIENSSKTEIQRKRKSTNGQAFSSGSSRKKFRNDDEREQLILRLIGDRNETVEQLMARATRLQSDILALKELANTKEQEWNEILKKRKLTEEAYVRLDRKIQMIDYMESDSQLPPAGSSLETEWENSDCVSLVPKEKHFESRDDTSAERSSDLSISSVQKRKITAQQRMTPPKTNGESGRKQSEASSLDSRLIGEGRQGTIVDVRSIIADHRLKHPETVPRRGRRMRNSVNIGLGAGGAMVETGHNADSRPSSTESCKSNPTASDSLNYKDMLVQFAKLSQQGEPVKVPQNYPDVTLHPVAPSPAAQNAASQPTGSLLHGILTKAQSPRSTTFSPTLARLLTAPERERNSPAAVAAASMSQQGTATQHLLQTYQGSNLVSINDLLSSSKARTEITITPVVNTSAQSHSNDLIQVDVEEETTIIDERKGNAAGGRDGKQVVKDNPPSPNSPPKCQGCMIRSAQFVCAGCGNQWYCSRTCQLAAWATHSDHCPPEPENSKVKSNA
ncbi:uncharacterized protein LOC105275479 isoform X2 [Ooceraea biroi]|uniref:uncharacterized protein LOC105275479 isoform X2 n=1 Tax=Ooceraea biroi TaxID=2015173 RepID=UPI0005BD2658|nr:uncharacterized protein LOC105275479 isoform X2 [Ooceraea biroi]